MEVKIFKLNSIQGTYKYETDANTFKGSSKNF